MMNEEISALLDKARESIGAARLLHEGGFDGPAVSCAYYAMFYCAQALLLQRGQSFSKHSAVIAAFGKEFAATQQLDRKFHRYLLDAFEQRQRADYDYLAEIPAEEAEEQIHRAEEFLGVVETYLSSSGNTRSPSEPGS